MKRLNHSLAWILFGVFIATSNAQAWAVNQTKQTNNDQEIQIFGPERFIRNKGKPITEVRNFSDLSQIGQPKLYIINGDSKGNNRVSSAIIALNGQQLALPNNFNQQVTEFNFQVNLLSENQLSVKLNGKPSSYITIFISGTSEPTDDIPPNISVSFDPVSDSGLLGDGLTTQEQAAFFGQTEANLPVSLFSIADPSNALNATNANDNGQYQLAGINLNLGHNQFFVTATDTAGNVGRADVAIFKLPCELDSNSVSRYFVAPEQQPTLNADSQLYMPDSASFIGQFTTFGTTLPDQLVVRVGEVNGDLQADVVYLPETGNQVAVLLNDGGVLSTVETFSSGATHPTAIALGNFVGNVFLDIAIGHTDGNLSFLQGDGQGNFTLMPDMMVSGLGEIVDLLSIDFDGDGDVDLGVSAGEKVHVFLNDNDIANTEQLVNGDFNQGLNGWMINMQGHPQNVQQGTVVTRAGKAILTENASFLTTLKQTFRLSSSPQVLSFDILSANLDAANGGIPDAFEVSLLTQNNESVVSTVDTVSTAFFNLNPSGVFSLASGVTVENGRVSLDISAVAPSSQVTLYFDIIGNSPGQGTNVTIANVYAGSGLKYVNSFSYIPIAGSFTSTAEISSCDANSDNRLDLLISDPAQSTIFIYNQNDQGEFSLAQQLPFGGL